MADPVSDPQTDERALTPRPTPTIAIVGRPNVGKSTLFNRLLGRRQAIVHDQPGVTRDRVVARSEVAVGRPVDWVDTGGLVPGDDGLGINDQVLLAVRESDLLLFVVDGKEGLTTADERVRDALVARRVPTLLVVNKSDTRAAREGFGEFWSLGLGDPQVLSAEHGLGIGELVDRIVESLPEDGERVRVEQGDANETAVAIVGRPNVGKSSLLNRILGEERTLVSEVPGTTRDPIDTRIVHGDLAYRLIDTAGLRRRSKVSGTPEDLAVLLAKRQIERCDVALLVVEAPTGITTGDLAVAKEISDAGKAAVVAVNKWDLLDDEGRLRLEGSWPRIVDALADPPRVNISASTGRGVEKVFDHVEAARRALGTELATGELNRLLEDAVARHSPPVLAGRRWKLLYATQVSSKPPTFMLFANRALPREHAYRRYLENRLRETLALRGVPVRLVIRRRST